MSIFAVTLQQINEQQMKRKNFMIALTLLTTGTAWAEDFPKDSLKIVDIEEVVVIATPKENRKLRELPVAATVLSQDNMRANQVRTLPIIKNKESALRMEVKRCKTEAADLEDRLEQQIQAYEAMFALWNEFDASLIKVNDVHLGVKKIAGVRVPLLENV